jgi:preprotein translocase subunit SecG
MYEYGLTRTAVFYAAFFTSFSVFFQFFGQNKNRQQGKMNVHGGGVGLTINDIGFGEKWYQLGSYCRTTPDDYLFIKLFIFLFLILIFVCLNFNKSRSNQEGDVANLTEM